MGRRGGSFYPTERGLAEAAVQDAADQLAARTAGALMTMAVGLLSIAVNEVLAPEGQHLERDASDAWAWVPNPPNGQDAGGRWEWVRHAADRG
jgi:hypothetical protein